MEEAALCRGDAALTSAGPAASSEAGRVGRRAGRWCTVASSLATLIRGKIGEERWG